VGTPNMALSALKSPWGDMGEAVQKAVSTAVAAKTYDKMTDEIANIRAETAKKQAERETELRRPEQVDSSTQLNIQQATKILEEMPQFRLAGITASDILVLPPGLRRIAVQAAYLSNKGQDVTDLIGSIVSTATGIKRLTVPRKTSGSRTDEYGNVSTFDQRWNY
jgi:hypothetical protein